MPALPNVIEQTAHDAPANIVPVAMTFTGQDAPRTPPAMPPAATQSDIEAQRKAHIDFILHDPRGNPLANLLRLGCIRHDMVATTAKARAEGRPDVADPADVCLASLRRDVRDGYSHVLYSTLLGHHMDERAFRLNLRGPSFPSSEDMAAVIRRRMPGMPDRIVEAIGHGDVVDLGDGEPLLAGEKLPVTSGLAMDVGYISGYLDGKNAKIQKVSPERLHALAEQCVSQHGDNLVCLTVGYTEGGLAWQEDHHLAAVTPGNAPVGPKSPQPRESASR